MSLNRSRALPLLALLALATPSCRAPCPVCPKPIQPAPVTVVAKPLPCLLPDLPSDLPEALGYESANGQWIGVTIINWSLLVDHVLALHGWVWAAAECIEAR